MRRAIPLLPRLSPWRGTWFTTGSTVLSEYFIENNSLIDTLLLPALLLKAGIYSLPSFHRHTFYTDRLMTFYLKKKTGKAQSLLLAD